MNFKQTNQQFRADGVFGAFVGDDGTEFVSLQHAFQDGNGGYAPKLAPGMYTCKRRMSPRFGYEVFLIEDVPDFQGKPVSFIEIHRGNYNTDSDGCILLGTSIRPIDGSTQMISASAPAFNQFMQLQKGVDEFTLTVENV